MKLDRPKDRGEAEMEQDAFREEVSKEGACEEGKKDAGFFTAVIHSIIQQTFTDSTNLSWASRRASKKRCH